ncbi:MAG: M48 family metalloprotease [Deltaproteobacteria bacterium]|nr:M48 family metalloprotease [Deltaproteobacteria bacterium]MBW2394001.1 M48 family metalloprotease [Deltaproteobacteria bacterium]
MSRPLLAGLVLCLSLVPACARNPVSGRPQVVLMSAGMESEIGRQEAAKIDELLGTSDDADLQAYVEQIGSRLAAHSPWQKAEYTFRVVDTAEPNAFALPGGYIFLSRGLIALANSEDELACVIGHEIGHIAARHTARRLTVAAPFAIVGIPGAILGMLNKTLGAVVSAPARLGGSLALAPHSRAQERQADRLGMQLAAAAGWDPDALADVLVTLEREDEARRGEPRKTDFFDSHPSTPDRLSSLEGIADTLTRAPAAPVAPDREAFLAVLEGLLLGPNPKGGVFDEATFLHPEFGFALDFPAGWELDNQPAVVLATDPEAGGKVFSLLQLVESSTDSSVDSAVKELERDLLKDVEFVRINGLSAARLRATRKRTAFDLTWIAHAEQTLRIAGVSPASEAERLADTFSAVAHSFRAMGPEDRARVMESRLRMVSVQEGESLEALLERSGSDWDAEMVAIANGLESPALALPEKARLKVSIPQPYAPLVEAPES